MESERLATSKKGIIAASFSHAGFPYDSLLTHSAFLHYPTTAASLCCGRHNQIAALNCTLTDTLFTPVDILLKLHT